MRQTKNSKSNRSVKKTKKSRASKTNRASKRLTQLQSEIERELLYAFEKEYEKDLARDAKRTRRKNRKNEDDTSKEDSFGFKGRKPVVRISTENVFTYDTQKYKYTRKTYSVKLRKVDEVDLNNKEDQDPQLIFSVLVPYLRLLIEKSKRWRQDIFSIHIKYFDGFDKNNYVSSAWSNTYPTPEQQDKTLLELIEKLLADIQKYSELTFLITHLQIRFYKDRKND